MPSRRQLSPNVTMLDGHPGVGGQVGFGGASVNQTSVLVSIDHYVQVRSIVFQFHHGVIL